MYLLLFSDILYISNQEIACTESTQRKITLLFSIQRNWNILSCNTEQYFCAQFTPKLSHGKVSRNTQRYWWKLCKESHKSLCCFSVLQASNLTVSFSPLGINGFWNLKGRNASHKVHHCHQEQLHSFSHDWSIKKLRRHCHASPVRHEISSQVCFWDQQRDNQASHMHETLFKDELLEEVKVPSNPKYSIILWSLAHPETHALSALLYDWAATCPFPAHFQGVQAGLVACFGWW